MNGRGGGYLFIAATVVLTVYGQLILKWRMDQFGALPPGFAQSVRALLRLLADPAVLSSFAAAFVASLCWMAAMTRFELSYAYPFMSLNFVIVLILSIAFLGEVITVNKVIGVALIVLGTVVASSSGRAT